MGEGGPRILPEGGTPILDPRRVVYRFLYWLASSGRPVWHTVFGNPELPEIPQNCQNAPLFDHFLKNLPAI